MDFSIILLRIAEAHLVLKQFAEAEEKCRVTIDVFEAVPEDKRQDAIALRRIVNAWTMRRRAQVDLAEIESLLETLLP